MKKKQTDPFFSREAEKYENPVPSREYILAELNKLGPTKRKTLIKHFNLIDEEQLEAFRRRLKAMMRDGQLFNGPVGFVPTIAGKKVQGILYIARDGDGYVRTDTNCIQLDRFECRGLYEGDEVEVQIVHQPADQDPQGKILQLLKPTVPMTVGRFMKVGGLFEVLSFDRKFNLPITIPKSLRNGAKPDQLVEVKICREDKYATHLNPVGEIVEILGDFSTPGIEVDVSIKRFDLPTEWPQRILSHVGKIPQKVTPKAKKDRLDLTQLSFVTIDGDDAKDFDDAIYVKKMSSGGWQLQVAIADVGYYVKEGSALDKEAQKRGNSSYFPGKVVPMLPEALSNGICSLNPNVERLTMVCKMSISGQGEITRSSFHHAVICSHARLTYREVGRIFDGDEPLAEKYSEFLPMLTAALELYQVLKANKVKRGALELDSVESKVLFTQGGKIKEIVEESRNVAHKIIEECMLAANICAAKFIQKNKRPSLFRVHEPPPEEKLSALKTFLAECGLSLPTRGKFSVKDFAKLLEQIKERPDQHVIQTVILRSMSQAIYTSDNSGHFGLAYPSYTHFTSPIRRYPDLIIHRIISEILHEAPPSPSHAKPQLESLGEHCSYTERRSDEASRDAMMSLKCHYMQDKVGEVFEGVIASVVHFGLFIELKDIFVEGMVHVSGLGREYFHFDAIAHQMVGEASGATYRIGDLVSVRVEKVDLDARRIDLSLMQASTKGKAVKKVSRAKPKKSSKATKGAKPNSKQAKPGKKPAKAKKSKSKKKRK